MIKSDATSIKKKTESTSDLQGQCRYEKLIFFLNRRCHVGCASCNAAASAGNREELTPQWLSEFFTKIHAPLKPAGGQSQCNGAAAQGLRFSGYVLWTGGEPFLSFEALKTGIALTSRFGFFSEIVTSASWFDRHPEYLKRLADAGNFSIRISLDAEHGERVPFGLVVDMVKRAISLGIETNFTLRTMPGRQEGVDHYIQKIKKTLPRYYRENVNRSCWVHIIPHIPVAAAALGGTPDTFPHHRKWQRPCQQGFKDLVVGEDGFIYPCCGLFTLACYPRFRAGNPLLEDWHTISDRRFRRPLFRALRTQGPYHICRELGLRPESWGWPPFRTPCHLCLALFNLYADRVFAYYCG